MRLGRKTPATAHAMAHAGDVALCAECAKLAGPFAEGCDVEGNPWDTLAADWWPKFKPLLDR
jgi:hypothetical protein